MSELFNRKYIFMNENLDNKENVFEFLANKVVEFGLAKNSEDVVKAFEDREAQASTGMQNGIAIPHALTSSVKQPAVLYVKVKKPISDWETFDDTKVDKVIAMLVPKNGEKEHLKILSKFASSLVDEKVIENLSNAQDKNQVYQLLAV